jgi:hypothetical protein
MNLENSVFAIYPKKHQIDAAVTELLANGFARERICVLCPRNEETADFAARKGTHAPKGTDKGPYADIPLAGTLGFAHPSEGPQLGALHDALIDMGVPSEWCDRRVVHGKFLVSVLCHGRDELFRALGILQFTGALDSSWAEPEQKYWQSTRTA